MVISQSAPPQAPDPELAPPCLGRQHQIYLLNAPGTAIRLDTNQTLTDNMSISGLPWWLRWYRICLQCRRPGFNLSQKDPLKTHSSILAWRIPWSEEAGGLQSTGSQIISRITVPLPGVSPPPTMCVLNCRSRVRLFAILGTIH